MSATTITKVADRFWSKVDVRGPDDCWEWLAARFPTGYGVFYRNGGTRQAHRTAYELVVGPIPDGLQIDHLCRNRGCVNPAHLEPVTSRENTMRGESPNAQNARKTHCIQGHPFDEVNTYYVPKRGHRHCRQCALERARRRLANSEEARQKNRDRASRYYYEKVRGR